MLGITTDKPLRRCTQVVCYITKVSLAIGTAEIFPDHIFRTDLAIEAIEDILGEDFDIRYNSSDPFSYLGNGELEWEREDGADLAFYLK